MHLSSLADLSFMYTDLRVCNSFINRDDLDCGSAASATAVQEIELIEDTQGFVEYPVK